MKRDLDGVYFRVNRGGNWQPVCFSDMTHDERDMIIKDRPAEWWKNLAYHLGDVIREIRDEFDIIAE